MKVHIGPYKKWIGPYQIADWFQKFGISEEKCDQFGNYLSNTKLMKLCSRFEPKRKIKIRIDNHDVWDMSHTLSLIILPMLKKLKEKKHGAPFVDDEDVPENVGLKSTEAPEKEKEWDIDENWFKRWNWILDELIWTFEQLSNEDRENQFFDFSECENSSLQESLKKIKVDQEGLQKYSERIENGLKLFGKYFQSLWD